MTTVKKTRLSRPCYNKPHRCPGWAGGGTLSAKVDRCENGSIRTRKPDPDFAGQFVYRGTARWRFGYCTTCGVITWPYALRWADWRYIVFWKIGSRLRQFKWWLENRRHG